jgi:hypothetical protein
VCPGAGLSEPSYHSYHLAEPSQHCQICHTWPPNSPDSNAIAMIWGIVESKLNWYAIRTREQSIDEITQAWKSIPRVAINKLCARFPTRALMMESARAGQSSLCYRRIERWSLLEVFQTGSALCHLLLGHRNRIRSCCKLSARIREKAPSAS